jgi:hypothetical protein
MCAAVLLGRCLLIAVPVRSNSALDLRSSLSPRLDPRRVSSGTGRPVAWAPRRHGRDPPVRRGVRCGRLTRPAVASSLASYRRRAADASAGAVNACRGAGSRLHRLMGPQPALTRRRSVKRGALSRTTGVTRWVKGGASSRRPRPLPCRRIGRSLRVGITALGVQPCTRDRGFRRSGPRLHLMRQAS